MVERTIVLATSCSNGAQALWNPATAYKVDIDAIAQEVKQEFRDKAKTKTEVKPVTRNAAKVKRAA